MESLRWILLGAGVIFVFIVYLLGRNRRPRDSDSIEPESEELPEFSANNWDDVDGNVADVHITAREPEAAYEDEEYVYDDVDHIDIVDDEVNDLTDGEQDFDDNHVEQDQENTVQDIIVLNVIARSEEGLHGDKINSAALANKLKYGHMGIFHRMGADAKPMFSVANMVEPGSFDPETIHELITPGITFFMQLPVFESASDALTEMLQCAYHVSEILDADLCDKRRELLTESEAEKLRELAKHYDSE